MGMSWLGPMAMVVTAVTAAVIMVISPHALATASATGHVGHAGPMILTGGAGAGVAIVLAYAVLALLPRRSPTAVPTRPTPTRHDHLLQVIMTTCCLALMAVVPTLA